MKLFVNLFCRDIEAQLRFYSELLGLAEDEHSRSPIYRAVKNENFQFGFHAPAAHALLAVSDRQLGEGTPRPVGAYATFMLASCTDVDRLAQLARSLGATLIKGPYATYYGQWQAVLADPEGHVFRLSALGLPPGVLAPALP